MTNGRTEPSLGLAVADILRLLRRDFYARTTGLGLTPALARLLLYVVREPDSRQIDLAARLEVSAVTLGRMVDRLVERGYVQRHLDTTDRRAFRLRVTPFAESLVGRLEANAGSTLERAFRGFTVSERTQLHRLLDRVLANLVDEC
ncbi:MAG: MarR family transcriptional regulator [Pseudomonadota bacterium]|jgi:hypothetical protein